MKRGRREKQRRSELARTVGSGWGDWSLGGHGLKLQDTGADPHTDTKTTYSGSPVTPRGTPPRTADIRSRWRGIDLGHSHVF